MSRGGSHGANNRHDPTRASRHLPCTRGRGGLMLAAAFAWTRPEAPVVPVVLAAGILAWYFESCRTARPPLARRQKTCFCFGVLSLVVALSWPMAALARTTSLLALVVQRQVLVLAAAPLMLVGLSVESGVRL